MIKVWIETQTAYGLQRFCPKADSPLDLDKPDQNVRYANDLSTDRQAFNYLLALMLEGSMVRPGPMVVLSVIFLM